MEWGNEQKYQTISVDMPNYNTVNERGHVIYF